MNTNYIIRYYGIDIRCAKGIMIIQDNVFFLRDEFLSIWGNYDFCNLVSNDPKPPQNSIFYTHTEKNA